MSGGVIVITLVVAFSSMVRSIIWSISMYVTTWVAVTTRAYRVRLHWGHKSRDVDDMVTKAIDRMKQAVVNERRDCEVKRRQKAMKCGKAGHGEEGKGEGPKPDSNGSATNGSAGRVNGNAGRLDGNVAGESLV